MARPLLDSARTIDRRRRFAAAGFDLAGGFAATFVALVVAALWLLLRSGLGRDDAGEGDAVLALALVAAVAPAWTLYVGARLWRGGATPGQRRMALAVGVARAVGPAAPFDGLRVSGEILKPGVDVGPLDAPRWRRGLRLAAHPLALPAWAWLTLSVALTGVPWLWTPVAAVAGAVALAGAASFALLVVRPSMPALHDRLARTALVRNAPAAGADGS